MDLERDLFQNVVFEMFDEKEAVFFACVKDPATDQHALLLDIFQLIVTFLQLLNHCLACSPHTAALIATEE